jgi:hypothetical protein
MDGDGCHVLRGLAGGYIDLCCEVSGTDGCQPTDGCDIGETDST